MGRIILVAMVCIGAAMIGHALADEAPPAERGKIESVLQIEDTKVTLLRVSRITQFDAPDENRQAMPQSYLEIIYVVEQTNDRPKQRLHIDGARCIVNGEPARIVGGVASGTATTHAWPADELAAAIGRYRPEAPDRTFVRHEIIDHVVLDANQCDLHIKTGFSALHTFKFTGIPLGPRE